MDSCFAGRGRKGLKNNSDSYAEQVVYWVTNWDIWHIPSGFFPGNRPANPFPMSCCLCSRLFII